MYLTYEEYQNEGGTLDSTSFEDLEFEAEMLINQYTYNRLQNESEQCEAVKKCIMRLMQIANVKRQSYNVEGQPTNISSQSNDGVSISYNVLSASEAFASSDKQVRDTIRLYLSNVKNEAGRLVLYKGLYSDE